jgi:cell shape-determining protein MreC
LFEEISRLSLEVQKRDTMIMTIDLSEDNSEKKEETESIAKYINEMKQIEAENNRLKLELTQLKNKPQVAPVADKEGCLKKCSIF